MIARLSVSLFFVPSAGGPKASCPGRKGRAEKGNIRLLVGCRHEAVAECRFALWPRRSGRGLRVGRYADGKTVSALSADFSGLVEAWGRSENAVPRRGHRQPDGEIGVSGRRYVECVRLSIPMPHRESWSDFYWIENGGIERKSLSLQGGYAETLYHSGVQRRRKNDCVLYGVARNAGM